MSMENHKLVQYLGKRFREFREDSGMTRQQAARSIGISPRTLAAYERGEREPTAETVIRIAEVYRTNVTRLTNYISAIDESGAIAEDLI